jgi:hypothetical protein
MSSENIHVNPLEVAKSLLLTSTKSAETQVNGGQTSESAPKPAVNMIYRHLANEQVIVALG